MTVGIPGSGIGGMFYLLSALWMPFHEAWRAIRGRSSLESRRLVIRQVSIAAAILGSMSATVWLLARLVMVRPSIALASGAGVPNEMRSELPRLLSYSALAISLATLGMILMGVTLLRLIVRPSRPGPALLNTGMLVSPSKLTSSARIIAATVAVVIWPTFLQSGQTSDNAVTMTQHLQRADAAVEDDDSATAERDYRAVIKVDPMNSHAIFRLAQLLQRIDRTEAERLFRTYIKLEPSDPWGYIALAEFIGRDGRYHEALEMSDEAVRRAPQERDAALVQARLLASAGRNDQAIEAYERWLRTHPHDVEWSRALAREYERAGRTRSARITFEWAAGETPDEETAERLKSLFRATAPALEPLFGFSRDSDGNTKVRTEVGSDFTIGDGAHLRMSVGRTRISDTADTRSFYDFTVKTRWRPRAAFDIEAGGGAVRTDLSRGPAGMLLPAEFIPTASVRVRTSASGNAVSLDVRFNRSLMDATPTLVANRVVRNEVQLRPDFALSRQFGVHGLSGAALIEGGGERNHRYIVGGGADWKPLPELKLSANLTQSGYDHASQAGYFAPRQLQAVEGGTYIELEHDAILVALDLGSGVERFKQTASVFGHWGPAFRGYALLSFRLQPGRELRFEIDSYNTRAGPLLTPTSGWKYGSVGASFHWALP